MKHHSLNDVPVPACSEVMIELTGSQKMPDTPGVRHLLHNESGQDLIEYVMVAALVGLGALAAMKGLKNSIGTAFNGVGSSLTNA